MGWGVSLMALGKLHGHHISFSSHTYPGAWFSGVFTALHGSLARSIGVEDTIELVAWI